MQEFEAALAALKEGNLLKAARLCHLVLTRDRANIEALHLLGIVESKLGHLTEALRLFDLTLVAQPDHTAALFNQGLTLHFLKRFDEALASYDRGLALRPNHVETLTKRGNALCQLHRLDEALTSYERALVVRPHFFEALANRGSVMHMLERFDEALEIYDRVLAQQPNHAETLFNRGNTLHQLKRFDEALDSYSRALATRPNYPEALANRGITFHSLKRFDEALANYDRSLALRPDHIVLTNHGTTLQQLKRFSEALSSYDEAVTLQPSFADAHWNQSLLLLLLGDFERGWEKYEWRWKRETTARQLRSYPKPLLRRSDTVDGTTIFIYGEQGFGDVIQFCRYVPLLRARGAKVVLEVRTPLQRLMESVTGLEAVVSPGQPSPDFDFHCPLLSLPFVFGTMLQNIPSSIPYLCATAARSAVWGKRLGPKTGYRVGIAWAGGMNPDDDYNRSKSIALAKLLKLFEISITFVILQKDVCTSDYNIISDKPNVIYLANKLLDFDDTASLISHLDLVISVDTSVAHLAGALGKPVWILLPFIPDWRWLLDREDSPWYPTAVLFRQSATRQWDAVIDRVHQALLRFVREDRTTGEGPIANSSSAASSSSSS